MVNATEWQRAIEATTFNANRDGNDVHIVVPFKYFLEISISDLFIFKNSIIIKIADEDLKSVADEASTFGYFKQLFDATRNSISLVVLRIQI